MEGLLTQVGLDRAVWDRDTRGFSRGMLQRLGLAQALVGQPRFLFLDEPTLGIDPEGVLHLRALLRDIKSRGVTILINSHDLAQLERVCDRVAFFRAGRVEAVEDLGSPGSAITRHALVCFSARLPAYGNVLLWGVLYFVATRVLPGLGKGESLQLFSTVREYLQGLLMPQLDFRRTFAATPLSWFRLTTWLSNVSLLLLLAIHLFNRREVSYASR